MGKISYWQCRGVHVPSHIHCALVEQRKQNGPRILARYTSVSESEISRIQEYAVPENTTKAIKFGLKIYKG